MLPSSTFNINTTSTPNFQRFTSVMWILQIPDFSAMGLILAMYRRGGLEIWPRETQTPGILEARIILQSPNPCLVWPLICKVCLDLSSLAPECLLARNWGPQGPNFLPNSRVILTHIAAYKFLQISVLTPPSWPLSFSGFFTYTLLLPGIYL